MLQMVIKSKKYNDEGMLLTLLQDFSDIPFIGWSKLFRLGSKQQESSIERFSPLCCDHAFNRITKRTSFSQLTVYCKRTIMGLDKIREMDRPKPLPCTLVPGTRK